MKNLFLAWHEFNKGKRKKLEVANFERNLEDNLFTLHEELKSQTYQHSDYTSFYITDPKLRHIHKASIRDRIIHHAIYRVIYPIFDKSFIFDSYSCRLNKGTHKAVKRLAAFSRKVSQNYTKPCFALKCDVKKFFDSVDHLILLNLIQKKIKDEKALNLIKTIIASYQSRERESSRVGLPIGNLTSQIFANIYLNELDQFIKHHLKIKLYLRYCDDFIIVSDNQEVLKSLISPISQFLNNRLKLSLHKDKVIICKLKQGFDFLGYITLPHYRVLRTRTKRRLLKRVNQNNLASYLGLLKHCKGFKIKEQVLDSQSSWE